MIAPSYKQINEFSDISVKYSKIKKGNKVESVHFKIEKNDEEKKKEKEKKEKAKRPPRGRITEDKVAEEKGGVTNEELEAVGLSRAQYDAMHDYERDLAKIAIRNAMRERG